MQTLRASPPIGNDLALCNPSILKFDPFLFVHKLLALCTLNVLLVVVSKMVPKMILAIKRASNFLTGRIVTEEFVFLIILGVDIPIVSFEVRGPFKNLLVATRVLARIGILLAISKGSISLSSNQPKKGGIR